MENIKSDILSYIPLVILDEESVYKYIIIKVSYNSDNILFVRGQKRFEYHKEIFQNFKKEFSKNKKIIEKYPNIKFTFSCIGGGRIDCKDSKKNMLIYGYSKSYGQGDHLLTKNIITGFSDNYKQFIIETSNEGY